MNRAERRKLEKRGISQESIMERYRREAYDQGSRDGVKFSYKMILLLCAYTARIYFDLGKKRLPEFMDRLLKNIDSFRTGQLESKDLEEISKECKEYGFDIEGWN